MQIRQLEYITEVSKTGSISKVANNLYVSQSAISKSIRRLEFELGVNIFYRKKTGLYPTHEGKLLINKSIEILQKLEEFEGIAADQHSSANSKIQLSSIPMCISIVQNNIDKLLQDNPDIFVDLSVKNSREIIQSIQQELVDFGILILTNDIKNNNKLNAQSLAEVKMYVCVNKNSPLSSNKFLNINCLHDQKIIMYDGTMKHLIEQYIIGNPNIEVPFVTNNLDIIQTLIERDSYISILSNLTLKSERFMLSEDMLPIPLIFNNQFLKLSIGWIKRKDTNLSKIDKKFLKYFATDIPKLE